MAHSQIRPPIQNGGLVATTANATNKRTRYYAALTRIAADAVLLSIVAITGFLVDIHYFGDDPTMASREVAIWVPLLLVITGTILLTVLGSVDRDSHLLSMKDWTQTASIISLAIVIVWALTEVTFSMQPNGEVAVAVWASAIVLVPFGRTLTGIIMRSQGIGYRRMVVVGDAEQTQPVIKRLDRSGSGFRVVGMVSPASGQRGYMQSLRTLPSVVENSRATDLLIAVSPSQYTTVSEAVRTSLPAGITVHVALNPLLDTSDEAETEVVNGVATIRFRHKTMSWQYAVAKRAFDISVALMLLVLASPLLAAVAIAIKLDSRGPIFFHQTRVGRGGTRFGMYKFRSMRVNAEAMLDELMEKNEASGTVFKMRNDPRVTRVGRILRKLSVDELPQLMNVLNGTMSLVGPRPPLPREVEKYENWHHSRLEGIPGITGLWQVKRGPVTNFDEMMKYDLEYLNDWSLAMDFIILMRTVPVVITGRGAY